MVAAPLILPCKSAEGKLVEDMGDVAVVLVEEGLGFGEAEVFVGHDEGEADVVVGALEEVGGGGFVDGGEGGNDACGAVPEFFVFGNHADHESVIDVAGQGHGPGGDYVEDELGGGACLEAGGSREDFRAGVEANGVIYGSIEVGVAGNHGGADAALGGVVKGSEYVGRGAGSGDTDKHIAWLWVVLL